VPAQKEQAVKPEAPVVPANVPISDEIKIPERKKHQLEISANDTTWIQVVVDGVEKKEVVMNQGDAAIYEANETISIIVGNGAGVIIKFDGKELPGAKKGEVLKLNLPERKSRAPLSEASGQSLKRITNPSVPAGPDGPDQTSRDNATVSPTSEKSTGTSQP
jgi:hypothetical protein